MALDTPKTKATECEKKKKFKQPVESSYCESREYSQQILGVEANQIKNTRPNAKPFEAIPPGQSTIDASQVKGQACSGLPGDPWWASGCECKCNDLVATGAFDGNGNPIFSTCQAVFEIVRHDVAVTSQDECLAQKGHHRELYF